MIVSPREVVIVGLGAIGGVHLRALEAISDVTVVAGIDTASPPGLAFRGRAVPVYAGVTDAAFRHDPSLVIVTTPTPTHAAVFDQVTDSFPTADILIEKPAADTFADASRLIHRMDGRQTVDIAYHMAFSPEVIWGARLASAVSDALGPPVAITASFADPYEADLASAQARLGSSWIDSGINALSVLNRFVEPIERRSLRQLGAASWSAFEARVSCRVGGSDIDALILTSWHVTAPARTTRLRYESGAELVMDHHGVAGHLVEDGAVRELFGSDGSVPRQESHYRALYHSYLIEGEPTMSADRSLRLHDVLLR